MIFFKKKLLQEIEYFVFQFLAVQVPTNDQIVQDSYENSGKILTVISFHVSSSCKTLRLFFDF